MGDIFDLRRTKDRQDKLDFLKLFKAVSEEERNAIIKRIEDRDKNDVQFKKDERETFIENFEFKPIDITLENAMEKLQNERAVKENIWVINDVEYININYGEKEQVLNEAGEPTGEEVDKPVKWVKMSSTQGNNIQKENALVVYLDKAHTKLNWMEIIPRLARYGEQNHYSSDHYKAAMLRFARYYHGAQLDIILEHKNINSMAKFLMCQTEKVDDREALLDQISKLCRRQGTPLTLTMNTAHGIAEALFHKETPEIKNRKITEFLTNCLLVFTEGKTNKGLTREVRRQKLTGTPPHDWNDLKRKCEASERENGKPTKDLYYHTQLTTNTQLFNINTHIKQTQPGLIQTTINKKLTVPIEEHMTKKRHFVAPLAVPGLVQPELQYQQPQPILHEVEDNIINDNDYEQEEQRQIITANQERINQEQAQRDAFEREQQANMVARTIEDHQNEHIFDLDTSYESLPDALPEINVANEATTAINTRPNQSITPGRQPTTTNPSTSKATGNSTMDRIRSRLTRSNNDMSNHKWDGTKYTSSANSINTDSYFNMQYRRGQRNSRSRYRNQTPPYSNRNNRTQYRNRSRSYRSRSPRYRQNSRNRFQSDRSRSRSYTRYNRRYRYSRSRSNSYGRSRSYNRYNRDRSRPRSTSRFNKHIRSNNTSSPRRPIYDTTEDNSRQRRSSRNRNNWNNRRSYRSKSQDRSRSRSRSDTRQNRSRYRSPSPKPRENKYSPRRSSVKREPRSRSPSPWKSDRKVTQSRDHKPLKMEFNQINQLANQLKGLMLDNSSSRFVDVTGLENDATMKKEDLPFPAEDDIFM